MAVEVMEEVMAVEVMEEEVVVEVMEEEVVVGGDGGGGDGGCDGGGGSLYVIEVRPVWRGHEDEARQCLISTVSIPQKHKEI
ncbi:unnamed protein product [Merluccius merluccius]